MRCCSAVSMPFGHGDQGHVPGDADDGADEGHVVPVAVQFGDEGAVDLEHVEAEVAQVGQARVAGAKVVERQLYAQIGEAAQALADLTVQVQEYAFGHFDFKAARAAAHGAQGLP
jgi:hypothetical protein